MPNYLSWSELTLRSSFKSLLLPTMITGISHWLFSSRIHLRILINESSFVRSQTMRQASRRLTYDPTILACFSYPAVSQILTRVNVSPNNITWVELISVPRVLIFSTFIGVLGDTYRCVKLVLPTSMLPRIAIWIDVSGLVSGFPVLWTIVFHSSGYVSFDNALFICMLALLTGTPEARSDLATMPPNTC